MVGNVRVANTVCTCVVSAPSLIVEKSIGVMSDVRALLGILMVEVEDGSLSSAWRKRAIVTNSVSFNSERLLSPRRSASRTF